MNKSLNRKGFTLIELLAVIVILAILVMLAIPAVTKYLTAARQGAFSDNAVRAIEAVRADVVTNGFTSGLSDGKCKDNVCTYTLNDVDQLLEKKLTNSPFGGGYKRTDDSDNTVSQIKVVQSYTPAETDDNGTITKEAKTEYIYYMCLIDGGNNGFGWTEEKKINSKVVQIGGVKTCTDGGAEVPSVPTTSS